MSGSAVAALTSCLDRYANGFELKDGTKEPAPAKGETFNRRMARWFYVRPFLGFITALVLVWGLAIFVSEPAKFQESTRSPAIQVAFTNHHRPITLCPQNRKDQDHTPSAPVN
jgi:hypothetical protein